MEQQELTVEQLLQELNPAEQEQAKMELQYGMTPQQLKAFFDSL